ncbi:MAG TPA: ABC transporter substrate-binding protein [Candidatus Acidoferrales bacterium]|nr:ABC transporter substrate-binding protein [Candidatus Acidoferrales bacterium]
MELADGDTLSPIYAANYYSFLYQTLLFDGLVTVGDDFSDAPDLATSWKSTPDKLHWTVELRHGVLWSDGVPLTAEDVVYTWRTLLDPKTGFPYRGQFTYIKSVTADGRYRVRFDLRSKNALFVSQGLGADILPQHILGKIPDNQLRTFDFDAHPIGTGPYLLQNWRHDQEATFVTNPRWFGGTATLKRIVFQVVLNDEARTDAMEEGAADIDDQVGPAAFGMLQSGRRHLVDVRIPGLYTTFAFVNFKRPGLGDINVRRAMMYGWDREAVVRGLYHGDYDLATGVVPSGIKRWYDPHVRMYPFDPVRARAMLDRAGYLPGADGIRRKGNVRLSYTLFDTPGNGHQDLDADFQADMRAIGIDIAVREIDFATVIDDQQDGKYDLSVINWGGVPDPDQTTLMGCGQFPPNGNNDMFFCDRKLSHELDIGLQTVDYAARHKIYDDAQRRIAEDVPVLYLADPYYELSMSPRVRMNMKTLLPDLYLYRDVAHWKLGPL